MAPWRRIRATTATLAAGLVLLLALLIPTRVSLTAVVALPVEVVLIVVPALVPRRRRHVVGLLGGGAAGLIIVIKVADLVLVATRGRPVDPLSDGGYLRSAYEFVAGVADPAVAVLAAGAAAALGVTILVVTACCGRRIARVVGQHRHAVIAGGTGYAVLVLVVAIVTGGGGVSTTTGELVGQARGWAAEAHDPAVFAADLADDPYATTPADRLLAGLRGKDVLIIVVESYGRDALENPALAGPVDAAVADAGRTLAEGGFAARSGFLTSSTLGGGSWLAHATLQSGIWVDTQRRYDQFVATNRLTLSKAFRAAGWRTVAVMPGTSGPWPEGAIYDYSAIDGLDSFGYRGPSFSWSPMPDQYALARFQRTERDRDHAPVMAEIELTSSHAPWSPVPALVPWDEVGDGTVFANQAGRNAPPEAIGSRPLARVQADYARSISYSLSTVASYIATYGGDDLVVIMLGDHQPTPLVTGGETTRQVPISVIARDPAVLDDVTDWDWSPGLRPATDAPVWTMDAFRNRFFAAFGR